MPVHRLSLTLRALLLVPLLAVGVDHARASLACGPRAESCLQAAGHGWLGVAGVVVLALYAVALALGVARLAAGRRAGLPPVGAGAPARSPGFLRLWLLGAGGVAAVCGGQALLAISLGDGAALGGGWLELLAFCAVAGAALALALRVAPAAAALVRSLVPAALRLLPRPDGAWAIPAAPARCPRVRFALVAPGRGPPAALD